MTEAVLRCTHPGCSFKGTARGDTVAKGVLAAFIVSAAITQHMKDEHPKRLRRIWRKIFN